MALHIALAAGGTGGHLVPADALGQELRARGHHVALITDDRGMAYPGLFEGITRHVIPAGRLQGGPLGWIKAWRAIRQGKAAAARLYEGFAPSVVVGFGGYPILPALMAAHAAKIPTIIHEQNAVLGRVNRMLARKVDIIATAYPDVKRLAPSQLGKVELVGNPVRAEVEALRDQPYPYLSNEGLFRVLVVGGSQGASVLSKVVPEGLGLLPQGFRQRLQVTQQCRPEDIETVREAYAKLGIPAELGTYLPDLPQRLAWTHLVIARAGASTLAELTAAGRPAILVPLPSATDDHQTANCAEIVAAGGARMIPQSRFTAIELGKQMQKLGLEAEALANAATRARSVGRPGAASRLADIVEALANQHGGDYGRRSLKERRRSYA